MIASTIIKKNAMIKDNDNTMTNWQKNNKMC